MVQPKLALPLTDRYIQAQSGNDVKLEKTITFDAASSVLPDNLDKSANGDKLETYGDHQRAYDAAGVDRVSGQPSLIIQRRVPRDVAIQVAAHSREIAQSWARRVETRNQSDKGDNRSGADTLNRLELDVAQAIREKVLPLLDLSRFGIDPDVNLDECRRIRKAS